MIQFNFIPQIVKGKPKILGTGILTADEKEAIFFSSSDWDSIVLGRLKHPEIIFINFHGILIKGYESCGVDKTGKEKYNYQEWYCSYIEEKENQG